MSNEYLVSFFYFNNYPTMIEQRVVYSYSHFCDLQKIVGNQVPKMSLSFLLEDSKTTVIKRIKNKRWLNSEFYGTWTYAMFIYFQYLKKRN